MDFFFQMFGDLPKQGPGSEGVGCGTGRHTITLARHAPAKITALENEDRQIATSLAAAPTIISVPVDAP